MAARPFPLNQWYVCARSPEIRHAPLTRMICGVPLVFWRKREGGVAALDDRCPHRKYPLSEGHLHADEIECGYHGIRFGSDGRCTLIPAQSEVPRGFAARAYPVVEKSALVYIWMGDPAKADESAIPEFIENSAPEWAPARDYLRIEANWQLIIDNLLDLTHLTFVHKTTLASTGIQENPLVVTVDCDRVNARREMMNVEPAPIFHTIRHFENNIDRFQNITFISPNHVYIKVEARPAGQVDDPDHIHHVVLNHLTPETERSTHYFWSISRRIKINDPTLTDLLGRMNRTAFEEDAIILRHQQRMLEIPGGEPLVNLSADKAVNEARRIIRRKFEEEAREV
jgi:phenylpropionate dioxygenase-like ring-hydroxylating dioxygenase large terminal subunit